MTDELRRRLRESVGTSAEPPVAEPPVEEIVARGRRRRRRRRQEWLAGSALAALVVIVAVFVVLRPGTTQLHVVGPAATGTPSSTSTSIPSDTPPCKASSLVATGLWKAERESVVGRVAFTNTSKTACYLQGQPNIQLLDEHGQLLSVAEPAVAEGGIATSPNVPVFLAPGSGADRALLQWEGWCPSAPTSVAVKIVLPAGAGSVTVTPPVSPVPTCIGASSSTIYVGNIANTDVGNVGALALATSAPTGAPFNLHPLVRRAANSGDFDGPPALQDRPTAGDSLPIHAEPRIFGLDVLRGGSVLHADEHTGRLHVRGHDPCGRPGRHHPSACPDPGGLRAESGSRTAAIVPAQRSRLGVLAWPDPRLR